MPFSEIYRRQVALLIQTLPLIAEEECFALKGGTAINLFVRDMPRLSVDIDLTYLPVQSRPDSLAAIDAAMKRIAERCNKRLSDVRINKVILQSEEAVIKLLIRAKDVQIKVEVTPVLRGCVYEPEMRTVSRAVEAAFGFAEMRVVSFADLYGGKIVAALDRQHPRDLFDVRDLLANEGIDETIRRAFLVYLLSHNRPVAEVLTARPKQISEEFLRGFQGMTAEPISLDELIVARESLINIIVGKMPEMDRHFLISFERGEPEWQLLKVPGADQLPAIRWRQQNLDKMTRQARTKLIDHLEAVLST